MTMATLTTSQPAASRSWLRRWCVPLIAIALPVVMFFVVRTCFAYEIMPEAQMQLVMAFFISVLLGLLMLTVWWLFFSGFHWATKLVVVLLAVALPFGFTRTVRHLDFTGSMTPHFNSIWQPDPAQELERQLQVIATAPADGLADIDLSIGPTD